MTGKSDARRVVIPGEGIIGVSTAWNLAAAGASVTLLTEGTHANGASGRSLSRLNSAGLRSHQFHRLRMIRIDLYRTYLAREEASAYLRFDGGLTWARPGTSYAPVYEHERSIGRLCCSPSR